MKQISLLILLAFLTIHVYTATAGSVSLSTAQTVATNFYRGTVGTSPASVQLIYTRNGADRNPDFYVFNMVGAQGFVIVAAYDNIQPVIGYSTESSFSTDFARYGIATWMKHAAANIDRANKEHIAADTRITSLWNSYFTGTYSASARSGTVSPLVTTTWDQSPFYNDMCPYNAADRQRAVTGCVATAMAQIMKFWNYPAMGAGSYSYNDTTSAGFSFNYGIQSANFNTTYTWSSMPNSVNNTNTAVATLMYHCGVSVGMDYGDQNQGGSGAWVCQFETGANMPCSEYSFKNYFLYDPNSIKGIAMVNYTSAQWVSTLETNLQNGMPILYDGDDVAAGGHAWVCDGYDVNNMFHMNWGWSGQSNGYFAINNLSPGSFTFSENEGALIGIQPIRAYTVPVSTAHATVCSGGSSQLTASGPSVATYSWTPTTGLSCSACANPTATPPSTTTYFVTADSAGVQVTSTVDVNVASSIRAAFACDITTACAAPASFSFGNQSSFADSYVWDFGDSHTGIDTNPTHSYTAPGTYTVTLYATGACGTDTSIHIQLIHITDMTPSASGTSVCYGQTATLSATSTADLMWYTAAVGGTSIYTGASFTTPAMTSSTTYYVESQVNSAIRTCGPADNTMGSGGYFTGQNLHGIIFNNTKAQQLMTVDVYAQAAGFHTVKLQDSVADDLQTITVFIPSGHSTVTLDFTLPIQNGLKLAMQDSVFLFRNNQGASFPYTSSDGTVTITGTDANNPAYYYYFYNWKLRDVPCVSNRTPVVVTVLNGASSFAYQATGTAVSFTAPVSSGVTYTWNFGDGTIISGQTSPNHTYTTANTYTVTLIETNGSCSDTTTQVVYAGVSAINDLNILQSMSVYPNPVKEQLIVKVNSAISGKYTIQVCNVLGEIISAHEIQLSNGSNVIKDDVSDLASGIYFVSLQNQQTKVSTKIIKE